MFARFSALSTLTVVAALASTASALNILGLVKLSPNILQPGNKLINLNVLADVLSEFPSPSSPRMLRSKATWTQKLMTVLYNRSPSVLW